MITENIVTGTWLPVFPGFYETLFDGECMYESEIDGINEHVLPEELALAMIENFHNSNAAAKLWTDYTTSIAHQCVEIIEQELKKLGFIESIKFEKLISPREYNFANDSINVEVVFSADNIKRIRNYISKHQSEWQEYLKGTYTSYDGFMSHHSNTPGAEEWFVDNALTDSHNTGAMLQFLCGENDINEETLYYGIEDQVSIDIKALEKEALEKGWYVPDTWWNRFKSRFPKSSNYRFRVVWGHWCMNTQFILETPRQKYIFTISTGEIINPAFVIKRYFKIFIFGRLKDEKKKKS